MFDSEILQDISNDIFDVGMIAYMLLNDVTGSPPDAKSILAKTIESTPHWNNEVSNMCKEMVYLMLQRDPRMRLTAHEALKHPWFLFQ